MCEALSDLAQDDSGEFMICNCLHSWVACLFFQVFDLFAVVFTLAMYIWIIYEEQFSQLTIVPLIALTLSIMVFPVGPIGLFMQSGPMLLIYNTRILCIIVFSGCWAIYVYRGDHTRFTVMVVGITWAVAFFNYIWGCFVTFKAIKYCNYFYRGYDDVDPDEMARFVEEFEDKLEELRQREEDEQEEQKVVRKRKTTDNSKETTAPTKEPESKQTTGSEPEKTK